MSTTEAKPIELEKPTPVLEVRFEGPTVRPETVSLTLLSRVLTAVHQIAVGESTADNAKDKGTTEIGPFQLLRIERGSAVYALSGTNPAPAIHRLRRVGDAIEHPEAASEVENYLTPLETLSKVAKRLNCQILFRQLDRGAGVIARIGPETYRVLARAVLLRGETSILGTVKRVGGVEKTMCALRLPGQRNLLYCRVTSAEVARQLGRYLYQEVELSGLATWLTSDWRLVAFQIASVKRSKRIDLQSAFGKLYELGGKAWNEVDNPEALIRQLRGDDE